MTVETNRAGGHTGAEVPPAPLIPPESAPNRSRRGTKSAPGAARRRLHFSPKTQATPTVEPLCIHPNPPPQPPVPNLPHNLPPHIPSHSQNPSKVLFFNKNKSLYVGVWNDVEQVPCFCETKPVSLVFPPFMTLTPPDPSPLSSTIPPRLLKEEATPSLTPPLHILDPGQHLKLI